MQTYLLPPPFFMPMSLPLPMPLHIPLRRRFRFIHATPHMHAAVIFGVLLLCHGAFRVGTATLVEEPRAIPVAKDAERLLAACQKLQRPVRLACVGDSITYGNGSQRLRWVKDLGNYPRELAGQLEAGAAARGLNLTFDVRNFGVRGATMLTAARLPPAQFRKVMCLCVYLCPLLSPHVCACVEVSSMCPCVRAIGGNGQSLEPNKQRPQHL